MERRDEDLRGGSEAQEKFENVAKPPMEDTDVGSGAGGGSTGPGVTGITGTGATNSTGMNTGTTSTGATGTGMLDTGTGVTGAGSAENIGRSAENLAGSGNVSGPSGPTQGSGGAAWGSTNVESSNLGLGAESATPSGGQGLGPPGEAGNPARDVGEGEINPSAGTTGGMPMRSGAGAAGMERTVPGIGGHGVHAGPPSRLSSGTGAVGGAGPVGTSSLGREHMRDPMQSGADNPMNELTPDDRGGGIGMSGAGTGTPETQDAEEWPRERE